MSVSTEKHNAARISGAPREPEYVTLVDTQDRVVGKAEKMHAHREGLLHRAFSVILYDSKGRTLLQRRHPGKYHSAGLWSNTTCGHPRPDEPTAVAAERRLREEMGIACELTHRFGFIYRAELENDLTEHEFDHVFTGMFEGDPKPNETEIDGWRWVTPEELARDLARHPHYYTYWFKLLVQNLAGGDDSDSAITQSD